jgi:hypothetical protein
MKNQSYSLKIKKALLENGCNVSVKRTGAFTMFNGTTSDFKSCISPNNNFKIFSSLCAHLVQNNECEFNHDPFIPGHFKARFKKGEETIYIHLTQSSSYILIF